MSFLKNPSDQRALKTAGRIVNQVLNALHQAAQPGISTWQLEMLANQLLAQNRSTAPFKSFEGFNHAICVSINDEIVNGPPSTTRIIQPGDVVSIATAAEHRGIYAKAARTFYIGDTAPPAPIARLLSATESIMPQLITAAAQADSLNAILHVIPEVAQAAHLTILTSLTGAGIGKKLHDLPAIPNHPDLLEQTIALTPGFCFTCMPMLSLGAQSDYNIQQDGWTLVTQDGALAAHFADTLLMTDNGLLNITADSVDVPDEKLIR